MANSHYFQNSQYSTTYMYNPRYNHTLIYIAFTTTPYQLMVDAGIVNLTLDLCPLEVKWTNPLCVSFEETSFQVETIHKSQWAAIFQNVTKRLQIPFSITQVELGHTFT